MQIEKLKLKNFRCYDELEIDFEPKLTVIVGENGKGKTAIFDALAIALEPYLRSFDASGRQITPQDVRRVPVYKKDMRHIDGMECHYPVEIKLEGEVYGKKLTCNRRLLEGNVPEDDADEFTRTLRSRQAARCQGERQQAVAGACLLRYSAHLGRQQADDKFS